jgi:hypothetical protein
MQYTDPVYGQTEISEPILLDLIGTRAIQRLHGVLQHGVSALVGVTVPTSRFEHSVGVMLLVRQLGGSLEEQIAALLHDVSHTAFSHVIDYVFDGHDTQGYHEEKKVEYVAGTDIPDTLTLHGYNWQDFMDEEAFTLLEQPSPHLCADRLDYFLRDSRDLGLAADAEVAVALEHLRAHEGRIVSTDLDSGLIFGRWDYTNWPRVPSAAGWKSACWLRRISGAQTVQPGRNYRPVQTPNCSMICTGSALKLVSNGMKNPRNSGYLPSCVPLILIYSSMDLLNRSRLSTRSLLPIEKNISPKTAESGRCG